jgi:hypothetical protein
MRIYRVAHNSSFATVRQTGPVCARNGAVPLFAWV